MTGNVTLRGARESAGLSLRDMARRLKMTHVSLHFAELGVASARVIDGYAAELGATVDTRDRWYAAAGLVAPDLVALLVASPAEWAALRHMLRGGSSE